MGRDSASVPASARAIGWWADGQVAVDREIEPAHSHGTLPQGPDDRFDVGRPMRLWHRREGLDAEFVHGVERRGVDSYAPIIPRRERDSDAEVDGHGQHEPFVVVGVIADQVHAARGVCHVARSPAEDAVEVGTCGVGQRGPLPE